MELQRKAKSDPELPGLAGVTVSTLVQSWHALLQNAGTCGSEAHYSKYLDTFFRGGREALIASLSQTAWVQRSLAPVETHFPPALFGELHSFVSDALHKGLIENFFFMRKPPGLRLRFEASNNTPDLADCVDERLLAWCDRGFAVDGPHGVYEPEDQLFGGPNSMPHVEALFTLDSLLWLGFFCQDTRDRDIDCDPWNVSFAFLRALFDGLGIVGWEDRGVWSVITRDLGRNLPEELRDQTEYADLADEIRSRWQNATRVREGARPADWAEGFDAVEKAARRWHHAYFNAPAARMGPRQAAAYMTIFHWNRGGLPALQQALIADTLSQQGCCKTATLRNL